VRPGSEFLNTQVSSSSEVLGKQLIQILRLLYSRSHSSAMVL
jgi:hypothetical protein